LVVLILL